MSRIYLGSGWYTDVDEWNLAFLYNTCKSWCRLNAGKGYAIGTKNRKTVYMHILIARKMGLLGEIDHENTDSLDNREENLREASSSNNSMNRGMSSRNTSGYKGVSWHKINKKYVAYIRVNEKSLFLGYYDDPKEAHEAYKKAAVEHFGEFANFGTEIERKPEPLKEIILPSKEIILTEEEEKVELLPSNNNTGIRCIEYKPSRRKYHVNITKDKITKFIGAYDTIEEAIKAYKRGKLRIFRN